MVVVGYTGDGMIVVRVYFVYANEPLGTQSPKPFPGTFLPENLENFHTQHYAVCAFCTSKACNLPSHREPHWARAPRFFYVRASWRAYCDQCKYSLMTVWHRPYPISSSAVFTFDKEICTLQIICCGQTEVFAISGGFLGEMGANHQGKVRQSTIR